MQARTTEGGAVIIGPVQLRVLRFNHPGLRSEIVEELELLHESGPVRVIEIGGR